jgi:hypothetical protein
MAYYFKGLRQSAIDALGQKVMLPFGSRLILRPYPPVSAGLRVIGIGKQPRNSDSASGCSSRIGDVVMDQHPDDRLETPKQLAKRVGISEGQIRHLVQTRQLDHVGIGCRIFIPADAWSRFIAAKRVRSCHDETKDRDYGGLRNASVTTSAGPNAVAAVSARLARQTATKLKSSSRNGCTAEDAETAQVIPLRSS